MGKINNDSKLITVSITGLSHEGRGITDIDGKKTFVHNALPGEELLVKITKKNRQYNEAITIKVLKSSSSRVVEKCGHYGICGGCSFQHFDSDSQLQHKEKTLLDQLAHIAGVQPNKVLPPLKGPSWGYRRRARLGVKYVEKKQMVLVGFREKNGRYLAQLNGCETLAPRIGRLIKPLGQLISTLKIYKSIPQIEIALGDEELVLVFRHLEFMDNEDRAKVKFFAKENSLQLYLQPGNENTIHCIWPEINPKPLSYRLTLKDQPKKVLELFFEPNNFIQVNADINQAMVNCALDLLDPNFNDRILDLFCGLGNFSLPLATRCNFVTGVEVSPELVARARKNAMDNTISNIQFYTADLSKPIIKDIWVQQQFNKLLLDPPRSGAFEVIQNISTWQLERIVYISCNSASLARDTGELIKQGYTLEKTGVLDMFPHTQHSEAICLFIK